MNFAMSWSVYSLVLNLSGGRKVKDLRWGGLLGGLPAEDTSTCVLSMKT